MTDPIHPIIPHGPNIPPVSAPPRVERLRQQGERRRGSDERKQRQEPDEPYADTDEDDDGRPHIDVTV
jgi:hypothetical protein